MVQVNGKWERFSRSSNAGKILDDENALTDWAKRTMLIGAAYRPELLAQVSTLDAELDKKQLRDIAEECLVAGKGRARQVAGSAVHAMLDHIDLGHEWQPTPDYALACKAYVDALNLYGLVVVDVECSCINIAARLAGTMDRRYRTTRTLIAPDGSTIPIGSVLASDTKTGRTLEYNHGTYSTQIAAYVDSERYDVVTNTYTPFEPGTFKEWALIMHVVPEDARCEVYWVDLNSGREGLKLAHAVKQWRKRTDLLMPCKPPSWPVAVVPAYHEPPATTAQEPERPLEAPEPDATSVDVYLWLRERVEAVTAVDSAKTMLLREWPEGVPGMRSMQHTDSMLKAIEQVLDMVEKEYSLPFIGTDPRIQFAQNGEPPAGVPKSQMNENTLSVWLFLAGCDEDSALGQSLVQFASLDNYTELEKDELLSAALRGIGYQGGTQELASVTHGDARLLLHAASLVREETHVLRYVNGHPVMLERTVPKPQP